MKKIMLGLALLTAGGAHAKDEIIIAGTGDSQEILREIKPLFEKTHPGYTLTVPESAGSGGGIKQLIKGQAHVARTSRPPKAKEGAGLKAHHFADNRVVFATHPGVTQVKSLTLAQVKDTYDGKVTKWSRFGGYDSGIYPITRESGDSCRKVLVTQYGWPIEDPKRALTVYSTPKMLETLKSKAGTIGFLPLDMAKRHGLNIIHLDGLDPFKEARNILKLPLYIVANDPPTEKQKLVLEFLKRKEVIELMEKKGLQVPK